MSHCIIRKPYNNQNSDGTRVLALLDGTYEPGTKFVVYMKIH